MLYVDRLGRGRDLSMLATIGTPFVFAILLAVVSAAIMWPINVALYKRATGFDYCKVVDAANEQSLRVAVDYITMSRPDQISDSVMENIISAACIENKASREDIYDLCQLKSVLVQTFINNHLIDEDFKHSVITRLCAGNVLDGKEKFFPTRSTAMAWRMASIMTAVSVLLTVVTVTVVSYGLSGNVRYLADSNATTTLGIALAVVLLLAEWMMYLAMRPSEKRPNTNVTRMRLRRERKNAAQSDL